MDSPPSSWCIINQDRQTRALVAKEGDLFLLDQGGQYQEQVIFFCNEHYFLKDQNYHRKYCET